MSDRWHTLGFSLAALALCGTAFAGPKPAAHSRVRREPAKRLLMPSLRPEYVHPGALIAGFPNMTRMPESHLVAGLQTGPFGRVFTDTSGRAIGRMDRATGRVVWL